MTKIIIINEMDKLKWNPEKFNRKGGSEKSDWKIGLWEKNKK